MWNLSFYIIAACYQKILRQFSHSSFSVLYQDTLKCLDITTVTFHASSIEAKPTMIESDQLLLSLFTTTDLDVALIPAFPKLHQQVNSMELKQPWVLYNGNTYQEFYKLLCTLLNSFGKSLQALSDARGQTGNSKVSVAGSVEFKACVGRMMFYGNALQRIAKGLAIDSHLQNLEPLLNDHCQLDLKKWMWRIPTSMWRILTSLCLPSQWSRKWTSHHSPYGSHTRNDWY